MGKDAVDVVGLLDQPMKSVLVIEGRQLYDDSSW